MVKKIGKILKFTFLIALFVIFLDTLAYPKALLLYKNSEQGYGYNILLKYVAPELKTLSIAYDLMDVESEEFGTLDLRSYELIVTCYYSPTMPNAKTYLKRLYDFLLNGGKIFIINNIGATIDSSGSNHPGLAEINSIYNLIGISYTFGWKKTKPSEISIDKYYLLNENPVYLTKDRDVEPYYSISPYTKPIVTVKTSDGNSFDMGFVGSIGAIISYNYLFDDNGKVSLDIGKILISLLYGDSKVFKVLVIGKDNIALSNALGYALVRYDWKENIPSVLSIYDLIILFDGTVPITDQKLINYTFSGGTVVVISKGDKKTKVANLKITSDIFPIPSEFNIEFNREINYIEPIPSSIPLVSSSDNITVAWKILMGTGQVIYYPSDLLTKNLIGLFMQVVYSQLPFSIQPIINSFSIYLDDFPLPAYNRKIDDITREFGDITDNEFYYNVWWPTMKKLSDELNLRYTAIFVANYNASVKWPFSFQEYVNTPEQRIALKELLNSSIEIGIHGYNHIPLTKDRWNEEELMDVLVTLKIFLKNTLGEEYIPYTYVAPDNIIDDFGVSKLLEIFPTVKAIGTTYKNPSWERNYDFSVIKQGTVIIPRTTAGYYPVSNLVTNSVMGLMMLGTYQYFLHPDDLFSKDRNPGNKTWAEMSESLREFLDIMKKYYPYLRNHFSSESAEVIYDFFTQRPFIKKDENKVIVDISMGHHLPRYYYLRSKEPFKLTGGRIIFYSSNLYVVEQFENRMEIIFLK
ncbi:DUF2194 domain-containing protein [Fervidobacterium nodosum]|uniref:DUF2194 domain-containing protein n=1 Tax=Fervidobacterium nodosum (strain ATCC 35602 / DSM 5306 / Rt17-B1) TaxID=381764 RepID=A7HKR3_FERNB|nr:DUF2194 domain-containing protein [Fervidobacterium nodosum]ABS60496.1 conserved hypothetical protein [Fervidobacterium nodosum Rt17-B1]